MQKKIKKCCEKQNFIKISRKVAKHCYNTSNGYLVNFSDKFIIMQDCYDFKPTGFNIFPIKDIKKIRHNKYDKCYEKIMLSENETENIALKTKVDLTNFKSIFQSLKKQKKNVIVECENPKLDTFHIGVIKKVTDKSVFIHHFDATGLLDKKPTKIYYKDITRITFDDRYIDVFSKYLRKIKS